jgi:hypothetical protein
MPLLLSIIFNGLFKIFCMKRNIISLIVFVLCMPFISLAHPGHGETGGFTITHYFTEPVHIVVALVALIAVVAGVRYFRSNKQQS